MNAVELRNVTKTFPSGEGEIKVLNNINIKIKKGDFIAILGRSGSGKSTLLNMIGILDQPTKGAIYINNKSTANLGDNELARIRGREIGFIFQSFNLVPRLSAVENVEMPAWFSNKNSNASKLLDMVNLSHRKNSIPSKLSGGEKQRVAIARSLVNDPNIILADEPTGNLDSNTGDIIMKMFKEILNKGKTIIMVTHDKKIANLARKRIYIKDGKKVNKL